MACSGFPPTAPHPSYFGHPCTPGGVSQGQDVGKHLLRPAGHIFEAAQDAFAFLGHISAADREAYNRGITNGHNYFLPSKQEQGWEPPSPLAGQGRFI